MTQYPIPIFSTRNREHLRKVFSRRAQRLEEAERAVAPLIRAVVKEGDRALVRYAQRWDGFEGKPAELAVSRRRIAAAKRAVPSGFTVAVRKAAQNIRRYCRWQMPRQWQQEMNSGNPAALKRPTISDLSETGWVAINTVLEEKLVRVIIPKLKKAGAENLVEYPLNKIVM